VIRVEYSSGALFALSVAAEYMVTRDR